MRKLYNVKLHLSVSSLTYETHPTKLTWRNGPPPKVTTSAHRKPWWRFNLEQLEDYWWWLNALYTVRKTLFYALKRYLNDQCEASAPALVTGQSRQLRVHGSDFDWLYLQIYSCDDQDFYIKRRAFKRSFCQCITCFGSITDHQNNLSSIPTIGRIPYNGETLIICNLRYTHPISDFFISFLLSFYA